MARCFTDLSRSASFVIPVVGVWMFEGMLLALKNKPVFSKQAFERSNEPP